MLSSEILNEASKLVILILFSRFKKNHDLIVNIMIWATIYRKINYDINVDMFYSYEILKRYYGFISYFKNLFSLLKINLNILFRIAF